MLLFLDNAKQFLNSSYNWDSYRFIIRKTLPPRLCWAMLTQSWSQVEVVDLCTINYAVHCPRFSSFPLFLSNNNPVYTKPPPTPYQIRKERTIISVDGWICQRLQTIMQGVPFTVSWLLWNIISFNMFNCSQNIIWKGGYQMPVLGEIMI